MDVNMNDHMDVHMDVHLDANLGVPSEFKKSMIFKRHKQENKQGKSKKAKQANKQTSRNQIWKGGWCNPITPNLDEISFTNSIPVLACHPQFRCSFSLN